MELQALAAHDALGIGEARIHRFAELFFVDDGSGPIAVDPREGMDVELDKSFEQAQRVSYGDATVGQFHTNIPAASGQRRPPPLRSQQLPRLPRRSSRARSTNG